MNVSEEKKRKISVSTAVYSFDYNNRHINLIDAPGMFDFAGGVTEALAAADSAMIVISGKSGLTVGARQSFEKAKELGADGLVFGCLRPDGNVDMEAMKMLMKAAGDTPVTFHRAFDHCCDPIKALEDIISLGCARILTSGCRPTALEGAETLAELVRRAADRIIIMPGCGIRENNIAETARLSGAREFHFSARESVESGMIFRNPEVAMGSEDDPYGTAATTERKVAATIRELLKS